MQNDKFPSHYKLAQLLLKCKFPSAHKPLQKYKAPQKGPLKNIGPRGLIFTILRYLKLGKSQEFSAVYLKI